jgi:hypothetical protein
MYIELAPGQEMYLMYFSEHSSPTIVVYNPTMDRCLYLIWPKNMLREEGRFETFFSDEVSTL